MSMRNFTPLAAALLAALAVAATPARAAGTVEVSFVEPQNFTDIGLNWMDRERVLKSLGGFLQSLGGQLPDGQTLSISITNINLAGEIRFAPRGDIRVMRGRADWPEVELRYTLKSGTETLRSGQAKVYDMAYLQSLRTPDIDTEYGYEKRMLRRWFAETFAAAH